MDSIRNKSICKQEVTGVCCRESSHHTERESGSLCQERKRNFFLATMSGMWNFPVCVCVHAPSCLTLCDPADWAHQAPLSMEFSRQKYWHGLPFPTSGDLPNPGIEPVSFGCPVLAGIFFSTAPPGKTMELPGPGVKSAAPNSGSAESSPLDQ